MAAGGKVALPVPKTHFECRRWRMYLFSFDTCAACASLGVGRDELKPEMADWRTKKLTVCTYKKGG